MEHTANALVRRYREHAESESAPLDLATIPAHDAAQYVERMCVELGELSERAGLSFLAYLLEVAREEALLQLASQTGSPASRFDVPPSQA